MRGGARPGAGRKPAAVRLRDDGLDDAICLLAMAHERLVMLRDRPTAAPTYGELRQIVVARARQQLSCVPPAA
jgi:hypothetical protein